ncbi:hypothetical protein RFI_10003 [Reticulomyxa filosa]|uniref:Uncharacterized protein n=1 Tax=Reticulomyxa filosa TaxID=46433 RepID=X6NMG5_RETFI|nr:hypothetical protein RFI_10003 [Reticulomyxa filosa]|eukprot:ETO27128.1 hypothetical protein RFI_10003 [Reticulomyxa filosa]
MYCRYGIDLKKEKLEIFPGFHPQRNCYLYAMIALDIGDEQLAGTCLDYYSKSPEMNWRSTSVAYYYSDLALTEGLLHSNHWYEGYKHALEGWKRSKVVPYQQLVLVVMLSTIRMLCFQKRIVDEVMGYKKSHNEKSGSKSNAKGDDDDNDNDDDEDDDDDDNGDDNDHDDNDNEHGHTNKKRKVKRAFRKLFMERFQPSKPINCILFYEEVLCRKRSILREKVKCWRMLDLWEKGVVVDNFIVRDESLSAHKQIKHKKKLQKQVMLLTRAAFYFHAARYYVAQHKWHHVRKMHRKALDAAQTVTYIDQIVSLWQPFVDQAKEKIVLDETLESISKLNIGKIRPTKFDDKNVHASSHLRDNSDDSDDRRPSFVVSTSNSNKDDATDDDDDDDDNDDDDDDDDDGDDDNDNDDSGDVGGNDSGDQDISRKHQKTASEHQLSKDKKCSKTKLCIPSKEENTSQQETKQKKEKGAPRE